MKMITKTNVYTCCGKYYVADQADKLKSVKCSSCTKTLTVPLQVPKIVIVTK